MNSLDEKHLIAHQTKVSNISIIELLKKYFESYNDDFEFGLSKLLDNINIHRTSTETLEIMKQKIK
jgi:hypothetical protein